MVPPKESGPDPRLVCLRSGATGLQTNTSGLGPSRGYRFCVPPSLLCSNDCLGWAYDNLQLLRMT
jgi:hypothetical protein